MNAGHRATPDDPPTGLRAFLATRRAGLGAVAVVVAAAAGGWWAWQRIGDQVRGSSDATLFPGSVEVVGVPPWVRGDLRSEALRDASLDGGLPLDDPQLPRRLERAFGMHPWVREVVEVRLRHPAAARVEVRCREPVAMIAVPGGLLAVDGEGVVLPSEDFTPEVAAGFPRVSGIVSSPLGVAGSRWGDAAVHEAAALAAAIGPEWRDLGLRDVRPVEARTGRTWELVDASGRVVHFGAAPGLEAEGEPSAAVKVALLKALAAEDERPQRIDLTIPR
jgi:hypothetical protein